MKLSKSNEAEIALTISNKTIARVIGIVAVAVLLFFALRKSVVALTWIGTAFFLALALNAPVQWLANKLPKGKGKHQRRKLATIASIVVILVALIGFTVAIVPPLAKQTTSFIKSVPTLLQDAKREDSAIGSFLRRYNLESQVDTLSEQLSSKAGDFSGSAIKTVSKIGSSVFATLTILVLTVMMLLEGPKWAELSFKLIPARRREHTKMLGAKMLKVVQGYVNGQVTLAALASVLIVPMLFIMHVSYPIALMVIVFICGLIPMVGHTIGALICTTVALFTSLPAALVVLGYYILYQQIENYTLQPKIQANSTDMSPLLVFIAVLIGGSFGGLLGALVSIPVMGCIRILVVDYLERRDILSR